ncbi:hypothetical protein Tco_1031560 [Tanacetum coccineum]|uniref:Uncharacterized protein n=1 Tax=Tanacetum coccineum TaxID=301880 RepID=A0ABQ5GB29_9ASTR
MVSANNNSATEDIKQEIARSALLSHWGHAVLAAEDDGPAEVQARIREHTSRIGCAGRKKEVKKYLERSLNLMGMGLWKEKRRVIVGLNVVTRSIWSGRCVYLVPVYIDCKEQA